jgi:arginyl-tRNA synthetase
MQESLQNLILSSLSSLSEQGAIELDTLPKVQIERTRDPTHGDFATNIALALAKQVKTSPRQLAQNIIDQLEKSPLVTKVEIAGPGFINFFLSKGASTNVIRDILEQGANFGRNELGQGESVQVEFVSANPTGPLHVGHGRGAAVGDSLCRLLSACGYEVTREFYYNDAGAQIDNLALSVQSRCQGLTPEAPNWPADGYRGDYIIDVAKAYMARESVRSEDRTVTALGDINDVQAIRDFAVAYLRREQDLDLKAFGVQFDIYFLESSLYESQAVDATVNRLIENDFTYEEDGALWLKTELFGDDKNRVMRKREGGYTYFVPDVAYHLNKWERGFKTVINEQGADHHSTVTRVRAGLQALDAKIPEGWPEYVLHQMVLVMRNGQEVKLSKRAGSYVTLRDLIDEVGRDATRYFLVARAPSSQITFDIDLALAQNNENPVYYIQYAHARICSMLQKLEAGEQETAHSSDQAIFEALTEAQEDALIKELDKYADTVKQAGEQRAPHMIANYLKDLAAAFHTFYNAHKVLVDEAKVRQARVALCIATKQVLRSGLDLLGVSAPESM